MIALGCDHAGFELKNSIIRHLEQKGVPYKDFGTYSEKSCDYPEFAEKAALAVASGECCFGILVCGTGLGIAMAANKVRGIRCAPCTDCYSAEMTRMHNDANVLALGARVLGTGLALKICDSFLNTAFEGGKHVKRVSMIDSIERRGEQ